MSADIYTKAFPLPPAWQLAMRLINHLDPDLFWGGRRMSKSLAMPSEHKGGLEFDYWVSNPWLNHTVKSTTTTTPSLAAPGVLSGPPTDHNSSQNGYDTTTSSPVDDSSSETDSSTAAAPQSVMEDTFHECKSDDDDAEAYYDVELPTKAHHDGACFNSRVDDSVVMGSVNPPSACNPPLGDEPVAASPWQPLQQDIKKVHVSQQQKHCSRRHYRSRRQYTAACYWSP